MTSRAPTRAVIWWMAAGPALTKCAAAGHGRRSRGRSTSSEPLNERSLTSLVCIYARLGPRWPVCGAGHGRYPVVGPSFAVHDDWAAPDFYWRQKRTTRNTDGHTVADTRSTCIVGLTTTERHTVEELLSHSNPPPRFSPVLDNVWAVQKIATFRVSRRRHEMYSDHDRLCVSLPVSVPRPRRISTLLHGPGCNLREW